jgi:hypothetical protein
MKLLPWLVGAVLAHDPDSTNYCERNVHRGERFVRAAADGDTDREDFVNVSGVSLLRLLPGFGPASLASIDRGAARKRGGSLKRLTPRAPSPRREDLRNIVVDREDQHHHQKNEAYLHHGFLDFQVQVPAK